MYINTLSNDSPLIIRQLPRSTNKRLSGNFSNETVSESTKSEYRDALKSGFKSILKYKPKNTQRKNRNRRRNIIWFNSLFNKNVTTFFRLLDKHFPISNRLHKIFDRNTVKVSYSCMKNVSQIIRRQNKRVTKTNAIPIASRNCREKKTIGGWMEIVGLKM